MRASTLLDGVSGAMARQRLLVKVRKLTMLCAAPGEVNLRAKSKAT
jgi:hypothetical protein